MIRLRRPRVLLSFAILLAGLGASAAPAPAQRVPDGMYKVENVERGFKLFCPRTFKEIPVQPGDPVLVGQYVRSVTRTGGNSSGNKRRPTSANDTEMWIFSIAKPSEEPKLDIKVTAPVPVDVPGSPGGVKDKANEKADGERGDAGGDAGGEGEKNKDDKPKPKNWNEIYAQRLSASSFEELIKKRLGNWHVYEEEQKSDREREWTEYRLGLVPRTGGKNKKPRIPAFKELKTRTGAAWVYELPDRYIGLLGMAPAADLGKRYKDFYRAARSLEPMELDSSDRDEMREYYSRNPEYKQPEFRIERRAGLARGWKAIDTVNYLILHHTRDERLLERLEKNLEVMRSFYEELFPAVEEVQAVSVVRVCKNSQEYLDYGGRPGTAGYWNFVQEELVLFDNIAGQAGSRRGNIDTYIVLYHEAFHQYIFYSTVELPPHTWFNEGYADYFSGAQIYTNTLRVKEVKHNPWRVGTIRKAVENERHVPIAKLIKASKAEYYAKASLYYAQGWSFVYFLEKSSASKKRPHWQRILPVYFHELKRAWEGELVNLNDNTTLEDKTKAQQRARDHALEIAFAEVDVAELETEWKKFVLKFPRK